MVQRDHAFKKVHFKKETENFEKVSFSNKTLRSSKRQLLIARHRRCLVLSSPHKILCDCIWEKLEIQFSSFLSVVFVSFRCLDRFIEFYHSFCFVKSSLRDGIAC